MHKRRRGHDACIEDKPADAELPRHRPHTPRLLVITGRKRRRHKTPSQISRARFSSLFKPLNRSWQPAAADLAENTRRHIWKQDWITKELERTGPLKALKRKTALMGVGGWWGGRTVNKLDHLILPFRECLCRSGSLLLKVSPSKMFRFFFFFSFPFLFLWTLTEKMKTLTERARTVCLWISVFLLSMVLAVSVKRGLPSGKKDVWINRKSCAAEVHSRRKHTGTLPFVGNLRDASLHSSCPGSH